MSRWQPPSSQRLIQTAALAGAFAVLVISARHLPAAVAGYLLLLGAVAVARADEHVFAIWLLYGFVYWSLGVGRGVDDDGLLLTLTSVAQVLGLAAAFLFPATVREFNRPLFWAAGALLVLPIQCNNPYYTPAFSIARVLLFAAVELLRPSELWVVKQYPLFAKREALVLIVVLHALAVRYLGAREPEDVLPVRAPSPEAPAHTTTVDTELAEAEDMLDRWAKRQD